MEIYLRLGCLGGNIGGFYRFGLGDGSGTPSLGVNLMSGTKARKPLGKRINRPYFSSFSLVFSLKEHSRDTQGEKQGKILEKLEL